MPGKKLLEVMGDGVTQEQAFAYANDVLKNAVGGISDVIQIPGLVNGDFEDVKTVMSEPGTAMMGTAVAGSPDRDNKDGQLLEAHVDADVQEATSMGAMSRSMCSTMASIASSLRASLPNPCACPPSAVMCCVALQRMRCTSFPVRSFHSSASGKGALRLVMGGQPACRASSAFSATMCS